MRVLPRPGGAGGRAPRGRGSGIRRPARAEGALRGGQKGRGHAPAPGTWCGRGGAPGASGAPGRPASPAPPDHAPTGGPSPSPSRPRPLDFSPELPRRRFPAAADSSESASVRWGKPSGPASGAAAAAALRFRADPAVSGKRPRGRAVKRSWGLAGRRWTRAPLGGAGSGSPVGPGSAPEGRLGARRGSWPWPGADDPVRASVRPSARRARPAGGDA